MFADSIKTSTSAIKRKIPTSPRNNVPVAREAIPEEPVEHLEESSEVVAEAMTNAEKPEVEMVEEIAENDLEKGWNEELGKIVSDLEPEYGEEMYNAYLAEKKTFQQSLDEVIGGERREEDVDGLIGELEIKHEERVKEIFGTHYETVKEQQTKFFESHSL